MAITSWFGSQSTILFLTLCVPAIRSDLDLGALSWLPSRALPPYVSRDKVFSGNVLEAVRLKHRRSRHKWPYVRLQEQGRKTISTPTI